MESTEITLDKPRHLRFTIGSLIALEEKLGAPTAEIVLSVRQISARSINGLTWAGLRWEDPALTFEETSKLITVYLESELGSMTYLTQTLDVALVKSGIFGRPKSEGDSGNAPSPTSPSA